MGENLFLPHHPTLAVFISLLRQAFFHLMLRQ